MALSDLEALILEIGKLPPEKFAELEKDVLEQTGDMRWVPNMGQQLEAYNSPADIVFYGGQAGGGKSDLICGLSLTSHRRSLVLRRIKSDARELLDRYEEIIGHSDGRRTDVSEWRIDDRLVRIRGCEREADKQRFKGIPHDLIAFDEIGDFLETQFRFIMGWNRSADTTQRCRVVATGNPPTTAEGLWVVRYWAAWLDPAHPNPANPGELRWYITVGDEDVEVDGPGPHTIPGESKPVFARSRTFIPGALGDNPDLSRTDYDAVLSQFPEELRRAYRDGDFTVALRDQDFQVIPLEWVLAAEQRWIDRHGKPPEGVAMSAMGFDPEGGGRDDGVVAAHYGGFFLKPEVGTKEELSDGPSQAAFVMKHRRDACEIGVDMGGGYGGRIQDALLQNHVEVHPIVSAAKTSVRTDGGRHGFWNIRAQMWWQFREDLDPSQEGGSSICLPPVPELRADLTAPTWTLKGDKYLIEAKEEIKKRIGRSPGMGDAVVMAHHTKRVGVQRLGGIGGRQPTIKTGRVRRR